MRRIIITIAICLLCVNLAIASNFTPVLSGTDDSTVFAVGGGEGATTYTKAISMRNQNTDYPIGVMYRAINPTGSAVRISFQTQGSYKLPTTEGEADDDYVDMIATSDTLIETIWKLATIDTVIMPYMRFRVDSLEGNADNTTFEMKVIR